MPRKKEPTIKIPKCEKHGNGWRCMIYIGMEYIGGKAKKKYYTVKAPTEAECQQLALLAKAEHKNGLSQEKATGGTKTLGKALDEYIGGRQNVLSPSTIRGYRQIRNNRFGAFMDKRLKDIPFQRMIDTEAATVKAKTVKHGWELVRAVLKDNGMGVDNIRLPQITPAVKLWLTPEQIPTFVENIHGKDGEIGSLLALCSLRLSEITALTWEKIDFEKRLIHIRGACVFGENGQIAFKQTNKNSASTRDIPLDLLPPLAKALEAVPTEKRTGKVYLFHQNTLYEQVNATCKAAGLPLVGVHGLRHSFASLCVHLGLPDIECMRLGGWNDLQTMRLIYQHVSQKDSLESVKKIQDFFTP